MRVLPSAPATQAPPTRSSSRSCLVYDFGSRNKKRGAPRAVWYGLEFVRYALRVLWLGDVPHGERGGPARERRAALGF